MKLYNLLGLLKVELELPSFHLNRETEHLSDAEGNKHLTERPVGDK